MTRKSRQGIGWRFMPDELWHASLVARKEATNPLSTLERTKFLRGKTGRPASELSALEGTFTPSSNYGKAR